MVKYAHQDDDQPVPERPGMSRRVVLVASGGVMLGIATAVGWASGGLAGDALDQGPGRTAREKAVARNSPQVRAGAQTPSPEVSARPVRHLKAGRHARVTPGIAPAEPVYYLADGPKAIALTIDDGPSPEYTPQVLRLLEKYHVTASFSMIGQSVAYYPGIARDVADAGHMIVNHTWDHANLTLMNASRVRAEISRATDAIHSAVGARPGMFRAPYGAWSRATLEYCTSENLVPLDWSVDPRDWSRPGVREIVSNIMRNTRTGSIILEHDGGGDRSQTVTALNIVIPRLLDEGYHFRAP
jgi:peptidoglycan-N-acetylglucosamine deacetylase